MRTVYGGYIQTRFQIRHRANVFPAKTGRHITETVDDVLYPRTGFSGRITDYRKQRLFKVCRTFDIRRSFPLCNSIGRLSYKIAETEKIELSVCPYAKHTDIFLHPFLRRIFLRILPIIKTVE